MDLKFILKYLIWQGYALDGFGSLAWPSDVNKLESRR